MKFLNVQLADPAQAAMLAQLGIKVSGRNISLALTPDDVRTAQELDTYLPGYQPFGGYRADQIAPISLKDNDTDKFRVYGLNNIFRVIHTETSMQAPVAEIDPETSLSTYRVIPYALGGYIPAETAKQSTYDVKMATGKRVADAHALAREIKVMTKVTTLSNWNTAQRATLGAGYQWNGGANSDPILDVQEIMQASTQPVTDFFFSLKASNAFLRHPSVRDFLKQMLGDNAVASDILKGSSHQGAADISYTIPGLATFHVAGAKKLNETTGNLDEIIGNDLVAVSNPPGDPSAFDHIRTIQTFRTRGPSGTGWVSREIQIENRGLNGGVMLVAGYSEDVQFVANSAGGLRKAIIQ